MRAWISIESDANTLPLCQIFHEKGRFVAAIVSCWIEHLTLLGHRPDRVEPTSYAAAGIKGAERTNGGIGQPIASAMARISSASLLETISSARTLRLAAMSNSRFIVGIAKLNFSRARSICSSPHFSAGWNAMACPQE